MKIGEDFFSKDRSQSSKLLLASIVDRLPKLLPLRSLWQPLAPLCFLVLIAALEILFATRWGPVAYSDSAEYIASAENLLAGNGLGLLAPTGRFIPLSLHPPLYPLLLSSLGLVGFDIVAAARLMNIVLFCFLVIVVGLSTVALMRSRVASFCLTLLVLTSPFLVDMFSQAMAEPVFLLIGLTSIIFMIKFFGDGKLIHLLAASVLAGMSIITRYAGIALLVSGTISVALLSQSTLRRRISSAIVYFALGLIPLLIWLAYLRFTSPEISPRNLIFEEHIWSQLAPVRIELVEILWKWVPLLAILPAVAYRTKLAVLGGAASVSAIGFSLRAISLKAAGLLDRFSRSALRLLIVLVIFSLVYAGVISFSYVFLRPRIDLIERVFGPMLIALTAAVYSSIWIMLATPRVVKWRTVLIVTFTLLITAFQIPRTFSLITGLFQDGAGYTSRGWRSSETIQGVKLLHPEISIISNEAAAILLLTKKPAFDIPQFTKVDSNQILSKFGDGESKAEEVFREEGGALVLFDSIKWEMWLFFGEDTPARIDEFTNELEVYSDFNDGTIYFFEDLPPP